MRAVRNCRIVWVVVAASLSAAFTAIAISHGPWLRVDWGDRGGVSASYTLPFPAVDQTSGFLRFQNAHTSPTNIAGD